MPSLVPDPDPALAAMIPARAGSVHLERLSTNAIIAGGAGDMCLLVCPGQPQSFAAAAGVDVFDVTMAVGMPSTADVGAGAYVEVIAVRAPGADTSRLIPAWRVMLDYPDDERATEYSLTVGSKSGTVIENPSFGSPNGWWQFLYAAGELLFVVSDPRVAPPHPIPAEPSPLLAAVIEALP